MLTISQLATHAGVTVRAVRHYHAKGLLPEPERDHSGYRRYDAAAVVELIKIRILADAGVPLSRVKELVHADDTEFAAAVEEIDRRLREEIRERQLHRKRIARLASGEGLALPAEALEYFAMMRRLRFSERMIELEQEGWTIISAQVPEEVPMLMQMKRDQLDNPMLVGLYRDLDAVIDCAADDPRLPALADRIVDMLETIPADQPGDDELDELDDDLIALLDAALVESVPSAPALLRHLEARGWYGFTKLRRGPRR